jgi:N-dimethylarginine dimethylaminohydrolase
MRERFLMCPPDHFEVAYVINPWMEHHVAATSATGARQQWEALATLVGEVAQVERIKPQSGVPDMVFTANAGLVLENRFVVSRFRHPERQAEEPHFAAWAAEQGFEVLTLPSDLYFEGAGDALFDRAQSVLWMGHGHRSELRCADYLSDALDIDVEPLKLIDARFYHLDTCFCPLEGGYLMYYPGAFDAASQAAIARRIPARYRIAVTESDAFHFGCNAVNSGRHIFMNRATPALVEELARAGFTVKQTPLTEFMKAGGSAKCLTLKLDENRIGFHQRAAA